MNGTSMHTPAVERWHITTDTPIRLEGSTTGKGVKDFFIYASDVESARRVFDTLIKSKRIETGFAVGPDKTEWTVTQDDNRIAPGA